MKIALPGVAAILMASAANPALAQSWSGPKEIGDGVTLDPIIDARLRYEHVDQDNAVEEADALTLRLRAGAELKAGEVSLLVEGEGTFALLDDYNAFPFAAEHQNRPAGKRQSLREFSEAIAAQPRAAELRETALAYEAMVGRLSTSEQASLRQLTADERLRRVEREARRWAHDAKLDLTGPEVIAFQEGIDRLTESDSYLDVADQFLEALREGFAARRSEQRGDERFERAMLEIEEGITEFFEREPEMLLFGATDRIAGRGMRRGRFDRLPGGETLQRLVRDHWRWWVSELEESLPADAVASLQSAADDEELARRLNRLISQTLVKDDLPTAFARLDAAAMDRMLLAPTDEFRDALSSPAGEGGQPRPGGGPPVDGPRGDDGDGRGPGRDFGRGVPSPGFRGPPPPPMQ